MPTETDPAALREQLTAERAKRVTLARCFLDAVGVSPASTEREYLAAALYATARDLDLLSFALAGSAPEDARLADTVARLALRVDAAREAAPLLTELLPELAGNPESD